jgi:nicotinamidase-related amidase
MAKEFAGMRIPETLAEKVTAASAALIVVDMQNDFVHLDGYCAKFVNVSGFSAVLPSNARLIEAARLGGVPVFYTLQTQRADGGYSSPVWAMDTLRYGFEPLHCVEDTWGWQVAQGVRPAGGDVLVRKLRRGAFHGTNLASMLRTRGVDSVVVSGIAATGCVESTVRGALENDFFAIVPADCIGDAAPGLVETALSTFGRLLAPGDLTTSEEVIGLWSTAAGA